jgi:hypothetical protein
MKKSASGWPQMCLRVTGQPYPAADVGAVAAAKTRLRDSAARGSRGNLVDGSHHDHRVAKPGGIVTPGGPPKKASAGRVRGVPQAAPSGEEPAILTAEFAWVRTTSAPECHADWRAPSTDAQNGAGASHATRRPTAH